MEKSENHPQEEQQPDQSGEKPPGQFVSDQLEEQTARFLEEAKRIGRRRKEVEAEEEAKGGPPPPDPE